MRDNKCPLLGKVVIDVGDDLNGHVSFPRSRWSDNLGNKAGKEQRCEGRNSFSPSRLRKMGEARSEVRSGQNTKALGPEEE